MKPAALLACLLLAGCATTGTTTPGEPAKTRACFVGMDKERADNSAWCRIKSAAGWLVDFVVSP